MAERDSATPGHFCRARFWHAPVSAGPHQAREARKRELMLMNQGPLTPAARA